MTDAFNNMNVCISISEMMQSGHRPPFSLYDVEIIYLCRYLFSLYWYGLQVCFDVPLKQFATEVWLLYISDVASRTSDILIFEAVIWSACI